MDNNTNNSHTSHNINDYANTTNTSDFPQTSVFKDYNSRSNESKNNSRKGFKFGRPPKQVMQIIPFIVLGVVALTLISTALKNNPRANSSVLGRSNSKPQVPAVRAHQSINREFVFPIKDDKGKEVSRIKYFIESADLQDEIIVKGQTARAVQGRAFLVINLRLSNDYKQGIQINTRNYVRLSVNNKNDLLAPDLYSDPVEVQAISTKPTRIGYTIFESDKNLVLHVGEIEGAKEAINLKLQ